MAITPSISARVVDRAAWLGALLVAIGGALAYHNSLTGPFVFDDVSAIVTNPTIRHLWPLRDALSPPSGGSLTVEGRPILNLSLAINYALGELDVRGYHVFNIVIHIAASLALFGIVRRTLRGPVMRPRFGAAAAPLATVIALVWAVHPLQTESVTYVVQRAESLMGLLYLLTLYGCIRGLETSAGRGWGWFGMAWLACLLGMGTKEVMVSAPVILLLYERTFWTGSFAMAWRRHGAMYVALATTWIWLGWLVLSGGGNRSGIIGFGLGVSWWEYWSTQFIAIVQYLRLSVWPHPLVFEYGVFWVKDPDSVLPHAIIVIGLLVATLVALKRWPVPGFLGCWFFVMLAPTSVLPSTTQMIVEHRMYLALAAIVALGVGGAACVCHRLYEAPPQSKAGRSGDRALPGSLVWWSLVITVLVSLTVLRNKDYQSELALWADTVAKRPDNFLAHHLLAEAMDRADDSAGAIQHYREAVRLKPEYFRAHASLGGLLVRLDRRPEAHAHLDRALALRRDYLEAHEHKGILLSREGHFPDAFAHFATALELEPGRVNTRYNFAHALAAAGRLADAKAEYEIVVEAQPDFAEAHYNLANVLVAAGRRADAVMHFETAIQFRPNHSQTRNNLANTLVALGRRTEAVEHYRTGLRLDPNSPETHHNLANALFEMGNLRDAAEHYEAALRLDPELTASKLNLAMLRQMQAKGRP